MKGIKINFNVNTFIMISIMILEVLFFMDEYGIEVDKKNLTTDLIVDASVIKDDKVSVEFTRDQFNSKLFNTTANKIMFVAHPDDESLWGGTALYNEKYLVVCITCGVVDERVEEFKTVMNEYGDDYIMLSYPDLVNGKKSDWLDVWEDIDNDIKTLLTLKDWDLVVTHNPEGEYGHIHHKITNKMVTSHANKKILKYFGRFYWEEIPNSDELYYLTDEEFKHKTEVILPLYETQYGAIRNLSNMIHYESWVSYNEWYGE